MSENTWNTAITEVKPNEIRLRGYRIDELMGRVDFGQVLYLLLRGDLPNEKVGKLMTAMLVSSVDHGPGAPSVHATRNAASTGAPLSGCVASGVLAINRYHGGAIEDCARAIQDVLELAAEKSCSLDEAADQVLARYKSRRIRVAGFGHRVHTADPRTARLFELAAEAGVAGQCVQACQAIEAGLERQIGKNLPINVDGAIGAVLLELGFEFEVMNGFFILARTAGLIAQAREEATRERRMRTIMPRAHRYDGPPPRSL
jgi:citrate synthase